MHVIGYDNARPDEELRALGGHQFQCLLAALGQRDAVALRGEQAVDLDADDLGIIGEAIGDDAFHLVEEELDRAELSVEA